ncbi:MAG: hypothetical protein KDA20_04525 [Phycisphaerales bacterium]|nr:hypothetical protein [Phycisphaerales bacterium]
MEQNTPNELTFPRAAFRWLAVLAFSVGFLAIASVIDPSKTQAVSSLGREDAPQSRVHAIHEPLGQSLGTFEGREFTIQTHMGADGPLYTLIDANGNVIVQGVHADELGSYVEGYDPNTMKAEGQMGIVDHDDFE